MPNITKKVGAYWQFRLNWTQTQNVANNSSTITTRLYWETSSAGGVSTGQTKKATITIQQATTSANYSPSLSGNQSKLIHSQTSVVKHNSNGTKTLSIGFSATLGVTLSGTYYSSVSASENVTLDPIASASTGRIDNSWTIPDNPTFTITRSGSNSFTHSVDLLITANSVTETVATRSGLGSGKFTLELTDNEIKKIIAQQRQNVVYYSAVARLRVRTYNGSTLIGTDTQTVYTEVKQPYSTTVNTVTPEGILYPTDNATFTLDRASYKFRHRIDLATSPSHDVGTLETKTDIANSVYFSLSNYKTLIEDMLKTQEYAVLYLRIHTFFDGQVSSSNVSTNKIRVMETYAIYFTSDAPPKFGNVPFTYKNLTQSTNAITGNELILVQSFSELRVDFPSGSLATGQNGATIKSYTFVIGTFTKTWIVASDGVPAYVDGILITTLTNTTNGIMTATDSNGNSATKDISVVIYGYQTPQISTKSGVRQSDTTQVKLSLTGRHAPIGGINYPTSIKFNDNGTIKNMTVSHNSSGQWAAAATVSLSDDNSRSYEITVIDKFGSIASTTIFVDKTSPLLVIDAIYEAVGVGKTPESSNYKLDVKKNLRTEGLTVQGTNAVPSFINILRPIGTVIGGITTTNDKLYIFGGLGIIFGGLAEFYNGISVTNYAGFKVEPLMLTTETGVCGAGITMYGARPANTALIGMSVNFRMRKSYIPSSVTFQAQSATTNITPNANSITENGFWFYITFNVATVNGVYYYWRGTYTC